MLEYEAFQMTPSLWIVKRYHSLLGHDKTEHGYEETEIAVTTDDKQVAIDAAIKQNTWS